MSTEGEQAILGPRGAAQRADPQASCPAEGHGGEHVPLVSVVTSAFNALPYLEQAIRSILDQSMGDFEFIVVDDGSTDGTWEVLEDFGSQDRRMLLLRNETNRGYAYSQNRGLAHARGKYVALQDQDDISHGDRLARQVEFLEAHPEVGAVGVWPLFIDERGERIANSSFPLLSDNASLQRQLLDSNCFCGPTLVIRRSLVAEVDGYDPGSRSAEDYDLQLRLADVAEIANLPEPLYSYRQHSKSVSRVRRFEQMRNKAAALERAVQRRYGANHPDNLRLLMARDFLRVAFIGIFVGEREQARDASRKAMAYAPEIARTGTLVEDVIGRYVLRQRYYDPFTLTASIFEELLPKTRHLSRARSRLLSRLHMREVFEGWAEGRGERVDAHWRAGVAADPRWALNRGVWAIGARRLLNRVLGLSGGRQAAEDEKIRP